MDRIFSRVSKALKENFNQLGWQQFRGRVSEFEDVRSWILDEKGNLKKEYIGMEGYVLFSERYYKGDMRKAFINVSAVLDKCSLGNWVGRSFMEKCPSIRLHGLGF